ncbi:MAG TPA: L-threonylcarbamoyladenylate synthase, partial [Rhodothermales bacterium]|nr:L-threonylcarbamoyladenylate synthase [Rhodothermales bacterium]
YFVPGPLTFILPKDPAIPDVVTGGLDTVGVRIPAHPVAQAFLDACNRPVAAPSANRSGRPSPTTWQAVQADLDGRIGCILQGDQSEVGLESTVVDCTQEVPTVLRTGVITLEQLRDVLPAIRTAEGDDATIIRSPGTRYRHYAPRARICLINHPSDVAPTPDAAYLGLDPPSEPAAFGLTSTCENVADYAHALFAFFRRCDAAGLRLIYCQRVPSNGLGHALMDRLQRAASVPTDESES